jgi:uncharacterized low-complexity protein
MNARVALIIALALGASACGQKAAEAPKVDPKAEQAAATQRAKEGPLGAQMQAVETAKGMEADLNKKAQESVDKIEKDAK